MIDIQNAEEEFEKFVSNYDINNEKIALKKAHTYRVEENSKIIAESLNLNQEDKQLAILIGLLHDIGRFEQVRLYDSFDDLKTEDHATLGVKVLKQNDYIEKYAPKEYWNTIFKAVENHNKLEIEEGLDQKDLMQAQIVRDADKLDIIQLYINRANKLYINNKNKQESIKESKKENEKENEKENLEQNVVYEPFISSRIIENLKNKEMIKKTEKELRGDSFLCAIGFLYDIYFNKTLEIIRENDYMNQLLDAIKLNCINTEEKEWIEQKRKIVDKELDRRLNMKG